MTPTNVIDVVVALLPTPKQLVPTLRRSHSVAKLPLPVETKFGVDDRAPSCQFLTEFGISTTCNGGWAPIELAAQLPCYPGEDRDNTVYRLNLLFSKNTAHSEITQTPRRT